MDGRRDDRADDQEPEQDIDSGDADFADEHSSVTFSDDQPGGPEGVPEPESPQGSGGDGGMDAGTEPGDEYRTIE